MSAPVSALLDQINNLPVVPKVMRELMAEFDKPEASVDRIAKLIGSDPVLAVKLLRLANSSYYARKGTVDRLADALVYVGLHATRNLALAVGLAGSVKFPDSFPQQVFWRYSLHSAAAARHIASLGRHDGGTAFALGLIRAIGEPLAACVRTVELKALDKVCPFFADARLEAERKQLGFSFVDVSAALAERWHFPGPMVTTLRDSQAPVRGMEHAAISGILSVGAWVAGEHEAGRTTSRGVPQVITERLRLAGISDEVFHSMPPVPELAQGLDALVH